MAAGLYSLTNQGLVPFVAGASFRQFIERLHIFKYFFVKLNALKGGQEVMELSCAQFPLTLV